MLAYEDRAEGRPGRTVFVQHGFLQKGFPQGIEELVGAAIERLNPSTIVTFQPDYRQVAETCGEPSWFDFATNLSGQVKGRDWGQVVGIGDSWATPVWQIAGIECQAVAFRVPRTGQERLVLVDKYNSMAARCGEPTTFAKYQAAFPLLGEDPALAARLFRGAARSGLYFEGFGSHVVAVRGFHDELFHPAVALNKVAAVDTIDEALQRFGLI